MTFRDRLRDQIEYCGFLDKEVADKAGISKRAIDSYVGSRACIPSADVAVRLAKVLNVTVEYLVTGETEVQVNTKKDLTKSIELQNKEQIKLIKYFENLSQRDKSTVLALAKHLSQS